MALGFDDPNDSSFALEKQRAAKVMRGLFKTAEIIRCQVVEVPDDVTAKVITPRKTYRYVRKPANVTLTYGTYVSVINPGGKSSGKIWEIINVEPAASSAAGVSSLNGLSGVVGVTAGAGISIAQVSNNVQITGVDAKGVFGISIDGGGSVILTGLKGYVRIPVAGTITKWTILGDQSGSIVIDVWKDTYANFPPTNADSITGGNEPELVAQQKNQDSTLSGWTTPIVAGDIFGFNVDSVTSLTKVTLEIEYNKS